MSETTNHVAHSRVWRDGMLERENIPVAQISDYLSDPGCWVWVDLIDPVEADLATIAKELGLHELAIDDALAPHERPKFDRYSTHEFLNMYDTDIDAESGTLRLSELSMFVTANALVTVRKDEQFDMDAVVRRWDSMPDLVHCGVPFLLYGLIDHVVDGHFVTVRTLDEQIEALEDMLFDAKAPGPAFQRRSFALRKSLVLTRRVVVPMREVVNSLMRRDLHIVSDEMAPYFQDVYDHVLRATEWTESLRDLVTTVLETNLTQQGNRLNVMTKKITSWAAIIAVPTAITGWYGQNLPYPGFGQPSGLITSIALIVGVGVGLYVAFRRAGWL